MNKREAEAKVRALSERLSDDVLVQSLIRAELDNNRYKAQEHYQVRLWILAEVERRWPEASKLHMVRFDEEEGVFLATGEYPESDFVGGLLGCLRALDIIDDVLLIWTPED